MSFTHYNVFELYLIIPPDFLIYPPCFLFLIINTDQNNFCTMSSVILLNYYLQKQKADCQNYYSTLNIFQRIV